MTFNVTGEVNLRDQVISIAPINETWTPDSDKEFAGEMTFTWKLKSGKALLGHASGKYAINNAELLTPQMRVITFNLEVGNNYFRQKEIIRLYDLKEWQSGTHVA